MLIVKVDSPRNELMLQYKKRCVDSRMEELSEWLAQRRNEFSQCLSRSSHEVSKGMDVSVSRIAVDTS